MMPQASSSRSSSSGQFKVRRLFAVLTILILICSSLHAGTISYVYGNNISSVEMEDGVSRGQVYTDNQDNLRIVRKVRDNVVMFDKLISRAPYQRDSDLTRRGPLSTITLMGGMNHALASYSVTTPIYPLSPVVMGGLSYGQKKGVRALALAGLEVTVPLARLWDSSNTFIQNGKLVGWGTAGISIVRTGVTFASGYGFCYRHNISSFCWSAGFSWLAVQGKYSIWTPFAGVGVCF